jgi:hypothetical protein
MFIVSINNVLINIIINTLLFCFTFCVMNYFLDNRKAAFFLNHTFHNAIIVYLTYNDTINTFINPLESMEGSYSLMPTYMHMGFHIAHMCCEYKNLMLIDWIHHVCSSCLIGIFNLTYMLGPIVNHGIFFATGLPGGIDYFLLFLVKIGKIRSFTEKWINRYLNLYCRMPGLLIWTGFIITCYQAEQVKMIKVQYDDTYSYWTPEIPLYVIILHILFITGNALYFGDRVIVSYARNLIKQC